MSQHFFTTQAEVYPEDVSPNLSPVKVLMGYDRPCGGFFMVIEDLSEDGDIVYSNLFEPDPYPKTLVRFGEVLSELKITLPQGMLEEVAADALLQPPYLERNKVVKHSLDDEGNPVRELLYS